jgi:hypothetical protein
MVKDGHQSTIRVFEQGARTSLRRRVSNTDPNKARHGTRICLMNVCWLLGQHHISASSVGDLGVLHGLFTQHQSISKEDCPPHTSGRDFRWKHGTESLLRSMSGIFSLGMPATDRQLCICWPNVLRKRRMDEQVVPLISKVASWWACRFLNVCVVLRTRQPQSVKDVCVVLVDHTHRHRHTDTQTHRLTDTQTHGQTHTRTQNHTQTDTHTHKHTHTHTYTHTHTHAQARTSMRMRMHKCDHARSNVSLYDGVAIQ